MESKISTAPTLDLERQIFQSGFKFVAGVDEVGRGALAGPVSVGVSVIDVSISDFPLKLRDSKLISKAIRENLIPDLLNWGIDRAVGHASPAEIDELGIVGGLRIAWQRALEKLSVKPDHVILDGKHNWLTDPNNLFETDQTDLAVTMKIKADQHCASVAAASVLAKVERDNLMYEADRTYPNYGFAGNVGYGSSQHMAAIRAHGATDFHRRSWNLPTA